MPFSGFFLQDVFGVVVITGLTSYLFFDGFLNLSFKRYQLKLLFHANNIALMALLVTLSSGGLVSLSAMEGLPILVHYLVLLSLLPIFSAIVYAITLEPMSLHLLYDRCCQEFNQVNWGVKVEMVVILSATLCLAAGFSQVEIFRIWFGYYTQGHELMTYIGLLGIFAFVVQVFFNRVILLVRSSLAISFFYPVVHALSL